MYIVPRTVLRFKSIQAPIMYELLKHASIYSGVVLKPSYLDFRETPAQLKAPAAGNTSMKHFNANLRIKNELKK